VPKVVDVDGRPIPVTPELLALVEPQVEWAINYKKTHRAAIFSEQKYEIGEGFGLKPGLFWGTADFTAVSPFELCVADLKLGYVDVAVGENEQLISYGLGALDATGWIHDSIRLVILQPKTSDDPKEIVYTAAEMQKFRDDWTQKVRTAVEGGPLVPSEDGCRFCKAAGACPALRDYTLALARREMVNLVTLSGEEIADLLDKGSMIENAMRSVRAHALKMLEFDPQAIPGYKRVQGEKKRVWTAGKEETAKKLRKIGVHPFEESLISPASAEAEYAADYHRKNQGTKKAAKEAAKLLIAILAHKPEGEPTLAKLDDDRPALGPAFTVEDVAKAEEID
jgi:hypothetical protein